MYAQLRLFFFCFSFQQQHKRKKHNVKTISFKLWMLSIGWFEGVSFYFNISHYYDPTTNNNYYVLLIQSFNVCLFELNRNWGFCLAKFRMDDIRSIVGSIASENDSHWISTTKPKSSLKIKTVQKDFKIDNDANGIDAERIFKKNANKCHLIVFLCRASLTLHIRHTYAKKKAYRIVVWLKIYVKKKSAKEKKAVFSLVFFMEKMRTKGVLSTVRAKRMKLATKTILERQAQVHIIFLLHDIIIIILPFFYR